MINKPKRERHYITREMFELFFYEKVQQQFEKDWEKQRYTGVPVAPLPNSREYAKYLSTFLSDFSIDKKVDGLKTNDYNVEYFVYNRLKDKKWQGGKINEANLNAYAIYSDENYSNFFDFIEDDSFFKENEKRLIIREEQKKKLAGEKKIDSDKGEIIEYNLYLFNLIFKAEARYRIEIDVSQIQSKNPKNNATLYSIDNAHKIEQGSAQLLGYYLKIEFLREYDNNVFLPLSFMCYIDNDVKKNIRELPVLVGSYMSSSIARKKSILSGEALLCQTSYLKEDNNNEIEIKRRLHFKQSENIVSIKESNQLLKKEGVKPLIRDLGNTMYDYDVLQNMIGKYEGFSIFEDNGGCIYRIHLTINNNFITKLSAIGYEYWGKIKTEKPSIFIEFSKIKISGTSNLKESRPDSYLILNCKSIRSTNGRIFQGHSAGIRENFPTSSFPTIFLKVQDELKESKKFPPNKISELLEEREEYTNVLKELFAIEDYRLGLLDAFRNEENKHLFP